MNKLSKKSIDKIILFLNDKDFNYITLSKREVKILFSTYQKAIKEIFKLNEEIQQLKDEIEWYKQQCDDLEMQIGCDEY